MSIPTHDAPRLGDPPAPSSTSRPVPTPESSPRVRLEVELLTSGFASPPAGTEGETADGKEPRTVLVVARDADLRAWVRACLHEATGFRVLEAASRDAALAIASGRTLHLVIVEADAHDVLASLEGVPAIVVAESLSAGEVAASDGSGPRVLLAAPFTSWALQQQVQRLIG